MNRAALCIGVAKTGGLPILKAARKGAEEMHAWALANGIDSHLITDESGPVTVQQLRTKIKELVDPMNLDQLIIYFSGHGLNIRRDEVWLLSGAPDEDEAVNVANAEKRARAGTVPHVVFLSDACRTAPPDTQGQSIEGHALFPNLDTDGPEKKVDVFWACLLGKPSLEIKDPNEAAKRHAAFTDELLLALKGTYPEALELLPPSHVLKPLPLKKLLVNRVPTRVSELLGGNATVTQTPDARITSEGDVWLAQFETLPAPPVPSALEGLELPMLEVPPIVTAAETLRSAVSRAIASTSAPSEEAPLVLPDSVLSELMFTGPDHFESGCGFKLRGAELVSAETDGISTELLEPWLVRVWPNARAHNVLFQLKDGRVFVLPAIQGFLATVSFEDGELRNVAYEPSSNSSRYGDYVEQKNELTVLRSLIASAADAGGFHLDRQDADALTERIRNLKGIDPTMALYAAYAYYSVGRRESIRDMQRFLFTDLGITFFDVAMLAGGKNAPDANRIFPAFPLLTQGWSLAGASPLKRYVVDSLWTIFDPAALSILRDSMKGTTT